MLLVSIAILVGCTTTRDGDNDAAASPPTSAAGAGSSAAGILVELESAVTSLEVGEPLEVTLTVTNQGTRSASTSLEFELVDPDGTMIPFHRSTLFVPFGDSVSDTVAVTTSRWSGETGDFEVRVAIADPAVGTVTSALTFEVTATPRVIPVFEDVTQAAGLITDVPDPECGQFANGAAWGDIDGDGLPDLAVTRLGERVNVFVNTGDGTFVEESLDRGVDVVGANGASFADYDNDGDSDLMVVGDGSNTLLRNDGNGYFDDVSAVAGVGGSPSHRSMSAAWGDYDADGLLDLYVTNYMACTGPWTTEAEIIANVAYHPDVLYHNEGDGSFADVTGELPDSDRSAAGFSAVWIDVDHDDRLDLYLANDFVGVSPDHNRLWRNAGPSGGFADFSLDSGAGLYMNTMGVGVGDVDRDGNVDLALSNIGGNKLLRGRGDATFVEATDTGLERPTQGVDNLTVTWGTVVADFDLDGWDDVFMAAGNLPQGPDAVIGEQPNMLFLNDATGERFLDVSGVTGIDGTGESKGVAAADYDGDGALDLYVVDQAGRPRLYRNVTPRAGRHWLEFDLVGRTSNADGCGARILVSAGDATMSRDVLCGSGGTGSANDARVHLGLGATASVDFVEIAWPSGVRQTIRDVDVDQIVTVVEPAE